MMGHRLVVLPDWQGLGLGWRFDQWMGELLHRHGWRYHNVTSHPALIFLFDRSPRWLGIGGARDLSGVGKTTQSGLRNAALQVRRLGTRSYIFRPSPDVEKSDPWLQIEDPETTPHLAWSKAANVRKRPDVVPRTEPLDARSDLVLEHAGTSDVLEDRRANDHAPRPVDLVEPRSVVVA